MRTLRKQYPGGGYTHDQRHQSQHAGAFPLPPHPYRRPPLRFARTQKRKFLLLPPRHPQTARTTRRPLPPPRLLNASARRPRLHPGRHRPDPPPPRRQRPRHQTSRPSALWPPDRQHQPAPQTRARRGRPHHRGRHRRPHPRPHRPRRTLRIHRQIRVPYRSDDPALG